MIEFFTDHTQCPNCGALMGEQGTNVFVEHKNEVDVFVYETTCENCGSTWDDYYKLVGHGNLKKKDKHLGGKDE
jgi:C4-type Zn-finger protein